MMNAVKKALLDFLGVGTGSSSVQRAIPSPEVSPPPQKEPQAVPSGFSKKSACPKCSTAVTAGERYCPRCRTRLSYNCPSCGAPGVDNTFINCPNCRKTLDWPSVKEVKAEVRQAPAAPTPIRQPQSRPQPSRMPRFKKAVSKEKAKSGWFGLLAVICLIVLIAAAIWIFTQYL